MDVSEKSACVICRYKISCQRKRNLYKLYTFTHDPNFKNYKKNYTNILSEFIKAAKKYITINYSIVQNKVKISWNFFRSETNEQGNNTELPLNIEVKTVTGFHEPANIFNAFFLNATHSFQVENFDNTPSALDNLNLACTKSFPQIHLTPVTANEI
jgi:hypothetical protein